MSRLAAAAVVLFVLLCLACGGGGGTGSPVVEIKEGEQPPGMAPPRWSDAKSKALDKGAVRVRILSAEVGKVPLEREKVSVDTLLAIRLRISNTAKTKKVDFRGWQSESSLFSDNPTLEDNYGNKYKLANFGFLADPIGQAGQESILPGESASDLLVFEHPVKSISWLRLSLPVANFDESGEPLRFQIPADMIEGLRD